MSKYNIYVPTVLYDKVKIVGKNSTFATGHNIKYLFNHNLFPGNECKVTAANENIPYVTGCDEWE